MKCLICNNQSVYFRKYSGEHLCSQCFSNSILRKTAKTISKYQMIKHNELVSVAVSGGKDSLVLLQILNKMSNTHNFQIEVITIDEGIPNYRNEALEIVKKFCNDLKVKYHVYSYKKLFDITLEESLELRKSQKTSSCSICGTFRRRAIDIGSKEIGANVIATGHNLDDLLQTYLINMISGDTNKIGWMDPDTSKNSLRRIKPFCEIYESELVFYAFSNKIPFQSEPCPHMNEGIRTEIREFLNSLEVHHSGIKNNFSQSIIKISQILKDSNDKKKIICSNCGNQSTGKVCSVCKMISKLKENQS